jgi:hypothetical protein
MENKIISNFYSKTSFNKIFIGFIVTLFFVSCVKPISKHRRVYVEAEVIKIFYSKEYCRVKFNDSLGNEHIGSTKHIIRNLKLGEKYWMAYDKDDIDKINIYYTAPIITDTLNYSNSKAIITNTYVGHNLNKNLNSYNCSFIYKYKGNRYKRFQQLVDGKIKKGDTVDILINKDRPKIAYIKGNSAITK